MLNIKLVLLILALVCFFIAAIGVPSGRFNLIASGLFLWVLSLLVGGA